MQEKTFSGTRSLNQNRYAFSFEYKKDGWTVRSEYIHSTGKAFAKSITNFNDANAKDCNQNAKSATRHRVYMDWLSPHWLSCQRTAVST